MAAAWDEALPQILRSQLDRGMPLPSILGTGRPSSRRVAQFAWLLAPLLRRFPRKGPSDYYVADSLREWHVSVRNGALLRDRAGQMRDVYLAEAGEVSALLAKTRRLARGCPEASHYAVRPPARPHARDSCVKRLLVFAVRRCSGTASSRSALCFGGHARSCRISRSSSCLRARPRHRRRTRKGPCTRGPRLTAPGPRRPAPGAPRARAASQAGRSWQAFRWSSGRQRVCLWSCTTRSCRRAVLRRAALSCQSARRVLRPLRPRRPHRPPSIAARPVRGVPARRVRSREARCPRSLWRMCWRSGQRAQPMRRSRSSRAAGSLRRTPWRVWASSQPPALAGLGGRRRRGRPGRRR